MLLLLMCVHGCNTNGENKGDISKMFLRQKLDMYALCETQLKRRGEAQTMGEVMLGKVVVRVSGFGRWRVREGVALLRSRWLLCSGMEGVYSRLMLVRVKIERENWVFISKVMWRRCGKCLEI